MLLGSTITSAAPPGTPATAVKVRPPSTLRRTPAVVATTMSCPVGRLVAAGTTAQTRWPPRPVTLLWAICCQVTPPSVVREQSGGIRPPEAAVGEVAGAGEECVVGCVEWAVGDRTDRQRGELIGEGRPVGAAVGRPPDAAVLGPDEDGVGVGRVGGDRLDRAGHRVAARELDLPADRRRRALVVPVGYAEQGDRRDRPVLKLFHPQPAWALRRRCWSVTGCGRALHRPVLPIGNRLLRRCFR